MNCHGRGETLNIFCVIFYNAALHMDRAGFTLLICRIMIFSHVIACNPSSDRMPSRSIWLAITLLFSAVVIGGIPAAAQVPTSLPTMIQRAVADLAKHCDGTFVQEEGFVTRFDVNGDGRPDYLLNYEHAQCTKFASSFCGTGGCTVQLFISRKSGSYVKAWDLNVRKLTFSQIGRSFRATAILHGTHCDRSGPLNCRQELRWNGKKLEQLSLKPDEE